ncbi:MAG: ABC transporter ATP-binding protein [Candidatus Woesebacteria bacterium]|jgi:ABC-2 type transport system ATP-binding protein/lipopolysaccharide transport system ATP-binding protein
MKKRKLAVSLQKITKIYTLHHEKPTFAENIIRRRRKEKFKALNKIDLKIYQGEKVGIIGANGSGKTTLLKIITGITTPSRGKVKTNGKIVSLIDLSAGFHPDLTGEENIFLNGLVIGMSKKEIKQKFKKIVEFADIGQFIDAPLYTYSAGMTLRLGFAVAVHSDPDILVLDENVAVGDERFRIKTEEKIDEFFEKKKTIVIVSHWLEFLKKNCERILWLEKGKVKRDGKKDILKSYYLK